MIKIAYSNTFHDNSIAIEKDGQIFAEAFERSSQCKRTIWGMPLFYFSTSMKEVMGMLGIQKDTSVLLISTWQLSWWQIIGAPAIFIFEWYKEHLKKDLKVGHEKERVERLALFSQLHFILHLPIFKFVLHHLLFQDRLREIRSKTMLHHLSHAANGVLTSPFDECVIMVLDGSGEYGGGAYYHFKDNSFKQLGACRQGLGILYADVTTLCGFSPAKGEEWKVMGLAAYGKMNPDVYDFFKSIIRIKGLKYSYDFGPNEMSRLENLLGGFRDPNDKDVLKSADLAHTFQQVFMEVIAELASNLNKLNLSSNLVYAGGCALNSSANGLITARSGFQNLHVPSAPGDDGNSLGAILYQRHIIEKKPRDLKSFTPYLGRAVDQKNVERILSFQGFKHQVFHTSDELTSFVAKLLSEGNIIGWMQGRAEFGPRALGNRSIVADPRDLLMKEKINALVKFREEYRPLAPSILEEYGPSYFEDYQTSLYMERTLAFKDAVKKDIPAVVHLDGTGRLQSVSKKMNPLYHELISKFHGITGIPLIVNTSLNVMGKPIVNTEEDSITLFFTTGLHYLVIGNTVIMKH